MKKWLEGAARELHQGLLAPDPANPFFEKQVKMSVYIRHIKKLVYIDYTLGVRSICSKKGWCWLGGHFFQTQICSVQGK